MGAEQFANSKFLKWSYLGFVSMMLFGSYFCYDQPAALEEQLMTRLDNYAAYSMLYSVYGAANAVVVTFSGLVIDKIGIKSASVLYVGTCAFGLIIVAIGASLKNNRHLYLTMLGGRIIYSMFSESIGTAQSVMIARWYKGNELSFAVGVSFAVIYLSQFINFAVTLSVANATSMSFAFWFGAIIGLVSLGCTLVACGIDALKEKFSKAPDAEAPPVFRLADIKTFPFSLYLVCLSAAWYFSVLNLFSIAFIPYVRGYYGYNQDMLNNLLIAPQVIPMVLSPLCGYILDRFGQKVNWMVITSGMVVLAYGVFLVFVEVESVKHAVPIFTVIVLGLSLAMYPTDVYACIPVLVSEHCLGTAYAILCAMPMAGSFISSVIVGYILDGCAHQHGLDADGCTEDMECSRRCGTNAVYSLLAVAVVSTLFSLWLWYEDSVTGRKLAKRPAPVRLNLSYEELQE